MKLTGRRRRIAPACAIVLASLCVEAIGQTPGENVQYSLYHGEANFDDTPHFPTGWSSMSHFNGLGVRTADFNKDGYVDIVSGGNGAVPVKIFYTAPDSNGLIRVFAEEILELSGTPAFPETGGCYGIDVGDFNKDTWIDIVVTRRKGAAYVSSQTIRDTVWYNDASPGGNPSIPSGPPTLCFDGVTTPFRLAVDAQIEPWSDHAVVDPNDGLTYKEASESFAVEVGYFDEISGQTAPRTLDLVIAGTFGIRYYEGVITAPATVPVFVHKATFVEEDVSGAGPIYVGLYRNISVGDVDSDGDLDLVVTRSANPPPGGAANYVTPSDRVWFNQALNPFSTTPPAGGTIPRFAWKSWSSGAASPPDLVRGQGMQIRFRGIAGTAAAGVSGVRAGDIQQSFDSALSDLDDDGDLDLVVASNTSKNVAYLNNGRGYFGSFNDSVSPHPGMNNGAIAFVFNSPTPDWPSSATYAQSISLHTLGYKTEHEMGSTTGPFHTYSASELEFQMDGKLMDLTTSVRIADVNGDGWKDVAFANRSEWQDIANEANFPYWSVAIPGPDIWDFLYFGCAEIGSASSSAEWFRRCIEAIGFPNDGTSYFEFVNIGGDHKLDWVESNFGNGWGGEIQGPNDASPGFATRWLPPESKSTHGNFNLYQQNPENYPGTANVFLAHGIGPVPMYCGPVVIPQTP